jgi:membrane-associated protein
VQPVLAQLAIHVHHFHRPTVDFDVVALAAAGSWIGVAGVGEAVLVAAGIAASRGHPDISSVVLFAWVGATLGGVAGWLIGRYGGRRVVLAGHWLRAKRERALEHGERFFDRFGWLAVYLAPSWVAGINGMGPGRFLPLNAAWALIWAASIGLGAYLIGPSVRDIAADFGLVGTLLLVGLAIGAGLVARSRMQRRRER